MVAGMQGIVDVRMEMEMQWNADYYDFYDEDDKRQIGIAKLISIAAGRPKAPIFPFFAFN